jgi:hypothetical protein
MTKNSFKFIETPSKSFPDWISTQFASFTVFVAKRKAMFPVFRVAVEPSQESFKNLMIELKSASTALPSNLLSIEATESIRTCLLEQIISRGMFEILHQKVEQQK